VIINAAGCGHTLKEYGHILQDDPEYREKAKEFALMSKTFKNFCHNWVNSKLTFMSDSVIKMPVTITWAKISCNRVSCCGKSLSEVARTNRRGFMLWQCRCLICCNRSRWMNCQQKVQNLLNTGADLIVLLTTVLAN